MLTTTDRLAYGRSGPGAVKGGADRPGPDAKLGANHVDRVDVGDEHPPPELRPQRLEEDLSGGGDAAADDHAIDAQQHEHVAHANAQILSGGDQALLGFAVSGMGGLHALLDGRPPADGDDRVSFRQGLEAAPVAAVAEGTVGEDG